MYRDAVIESVVRLDFPCLDSGAVLRALDRAQAIQIQPAADYLWMHLDQLHYSPFAFPAALPRQALLWLEWGPSIFAPASSGVLLSTRQTDTGYASEALVFFCEAPFLRYRLTYDSAGDLIRVSVPDLATAGGGLFTTHGWQAQAEQLRYDGTMLRALSWLFLAPVLFALSALNVSSQSPDQDLSERVAALDWILRRNGLGTERTLPEALHACRDFLEVSAEELDSAVLSPLWIDPIAPISSDLQQPLQQPAEALQVSPAGLIPS